MHSPIAHSLDALAAWRTALDGHVGALARALAEPDLLDDADAAALAALRERLASDKLVLAFVAEFSRGKSELVNAIFFGDAAKPGGGSRPAPPRSQHHRRHGQDPAGRPVAGRTAFA